MKISTLSAKRVVMTAIGGLSAVALASCGVSTEESADTFPTKRIEVIVPYPAGGGADNIARPLVEAVNASGALDHDMAVINRGGGGGIVGTTETLSATPDGYTISIAPEGPLSLQPAVNDVSYDPLEMTPILQISQNPTVIAVPGDSPFETINDLVDAAATNPGSVTFGEGPLAYKVPVGQLEAATDVTFARVEYEGDAASTTAMLGHNVDASMTQVAALLPHLVSGGLRALATTGPERHTLLPDVPTLEEEGINVVSVAAYGVFGPEGIPEDIVQKLADAFEDAMTSPEFEAVAEASGITIDPMPGSEFLSYLEGRLVEVQQLESDGLLN